MSGWAESGRANYLNSGLLGWSDIPLKGRLVRLWLELIESSPGVNSGPRQKIVVLRFKFGRRNPMATFYADEMGAAPAALAYPSSC